jgi:plasmid stabilization system protein ParE
MPENQVELLPRAERESREAFLWYLERSPVAAQEFRVAFEEAIGHIKTFPLASPEFDEGVRRCILNRYPYSLIYTVEQETITVVACMHHKRRPGYWR